MSIYPALSCARHIRPGNTAACLCCGERRFLSAIGAVAHLESGNCSRLGQWNLQYFASYHSGISPKFPPQYAPIHWFSCSNIFLVSNLAAGIPPILFQSLAKELPRARESWARDLEFREPAQATQKFRRPMLTDGYGSPCGDGNPYQCTSCDRTFAKLSSLMAHRQDKHGQVLRALAFWAFWATVPSTTHDVWCPALESFGEHCEAESVKGAANASWLLFTSTHF